MARLCDASPSTIIAWMKRHDIRRRTRAEAQALISAEDCSVYHGNCLQCGKPFTQQGAGRRRKFCSERCQRIWWKENRAEAAKTYTFVCQNCGKEYTTKDIRRDTCCSRECGWEWNGKQAHEAALVEKQCISCGKTFEGLRSGSEYCSDECQQRGRKLICDICGREFHGRAGTLYCSDPCRLEGNRRRYEEYMTEKIGERVYICEECGREFSAPYGDKRHKYCSLECGKKHWYKTSAGKREKARQRHRRRAMKYSNGSVDNIDPYIVFERDGWKCGICGMPVDSDLEFPDLKSASLDHIVPLAEGGTHTWDNVQLAHLICNSEKSDVGGGQLRLGIVKESANIYGGAFQS